MRNHMLEALLGAFLLAGCGPMSEQDQEPPRREAYEPIGAPTPAEVTLRVRESQDGKSLSLAVGERFAIELVGIPTAGYLWEPKDVPPFLEAQGTFSGPTSTAQLEPGFTGGRHWEVFVFRPVSKGEGTLVLEQRRPWETDEPPTDTFTLSVHAK